MALQALWDVSNQFNNKNGSILTNGQIYVYYQGRSALATTFHDEDGTVVNSNPIRLDNNGRATCYASSMYAYTVVVCDFYGKELFSYDITLHDAVDTAEHVFVIGTDGSVLVDETTLSNGVQYDLSVNTDIIATKEYVDDEVDNLQSQIDNKKDKQEVYSSAGSTKKTITNVEQNENGEMTVTYEDIDIKGVQYTTARFPFNSNKIVKIAEIPLYPTFQYQGSGRANLQVLITDSFGSEAIFSLGIIQSGTSSHMVQPKGVFRYIHPGNGRTSYPIKMMHVRPDNASAPMTTATLYLYAEFDESYNQQADWSFKAVINEGSTSTTSKVEDAWKFRNTVIAPQADFDQARSWWYLEPSSIETIPNVEITSPNGTIDIQSSIDTSTNTKTFEIDVNNADASFWRGYGSRVTVSNTSQALLPINTTSLSNKGSDIAVNNAGKFVLKKGVYFYHGNVELEADTNVYNILQKIDFTTGSDSSTFVWDRSTNANQQITLNLCGIVNAVNDDYTLEFDISADSAAAFYAHLLEVDVFKINGVGNGSGSGSNTVITSNDNSVTITETTVGDTTTYDLSVEGGSGSYTAGDGIDITSDTISVDAGKGLGFDADHKLEVKVGNGLTVDEDNNVITIDTEVGDVVETVEKLKKDLDTQITTNFDMPNISQVYDFADPSVSTLANGACMLCQSFTIPINHELRTTTDDADTPTLFGIYAQQNFAHKIMLALYEYTYAAEGEEHGSSTYVGDTGPVNVVQGVNEYPLKNRNPSITELRSDKVYYATLYLPNAARVNGLFLAGCPGYGNQSIPAEPRLSCAVENITWDGQELDMSDPTTTLNHYQEVIIPGQPVYYQYYIGPWQSGYNERQTAPRFYMQIRNGEFNVPVIPTAPFIDLGDALPHGTADQSNIPSFSPSQANSAFRDVTPLLNVTITSFEWIDGMQNAAGWAAANCVYDSGFANNLSGVSNSVVDLGQVVTGEYPGYAHRITFTTPLTLTAGTTYRFLCGCTDGSPYFKVWLDPTDVIHVGNNGWYVVDTNVLRIDHQMGMYNKLYDNNNNHYVI